MGIETISRSFRFEENAAKKYCLIALKRNDTVRYFAEISQRCVISN